MFDVYATTDECTINHIIAAWDNDEYCYNIMQAVCECENVEQQDELFAVYYNELAECAKRSFSWLTVNDRTMADAFDEYILRDKEEN